MGDETTIDEVPDQIVDNLMLYKNGGIQGRLDSYSNLIRLMDKREIEGQIKELDDLLDYDAINVVTNTQYIIIPKYVKRRKNKLEQQLKSLEEKG